MVPYLLDAAKGKTKPHFISWLIWSIVTMIAFFGQWAKGGGPGSWMTGATGLINIAIALIAFKNGTKNITLHENILFICSLCAIALWVFVKEPILSVLVVITIDASACFFTIKKTLKDPKSETLILFYTNIVKNLLAIIALQQYNLTTIIFPIYQLLSNSALIYAIIMRPQSR